MAGPRVSAQKIREHVERLGERHPPIDLDSVDYSAVDPGGVRARFAEVLAYMARVEMEVERNVLELAVLLPGVSETDRRFYADIWGPQEERHGIRLLYYLTGAATEKSAMMAYQAMSDELGAMGETAIKRTVIDAIKVQEPGHFAFYRLSADEMVQNGVLAPWQMHLVRFLRSRSFSLVGAVTPEERAGYGAVIVNLGLDAELERSVRDIVRVETRLLWAREEGLQVPAYALATFRDAADRYREQVSADAVLAA